MVKYLGRSVIGVFRFDLLWEVVMSGVYSGGWFRWPMLGLLYGFISIRLPYVMGFEGFVVFVLSSVLAFFMSASGCRLLDVSLFLSEFVSEGVPVSFGAVVCGIEVFSYLIRPFVLVLRPVINLVFGGSMSEECVIVACFWCFGLILKSVGLEGGDYVGCLSVFFYEWCVSCVQWYIVENIVLVESET